MARATYCSDLLRLQLGPIHFFRVYCLGFKHGFFGLLLVGSVQNLLKELDYLQAVEVVSVAVCARQVLWLLTPTNF